MTRSRPQHGMTWLIAAPLALGGLPLLGGCAVPDSVATLFQPKELRPAFTIRNRTDFRIVYRLESGLREVDGRGFTLEHVSEGVPIEPDGKVKHTPPQLRPGPGLKDRVFHLHFSVLDVTWREPAEYRYELLVEPPTTITIGEAFGRYGVETSNGRVVEIPSEFWPEQ